MLEKKLSRSSTSLSSMSSKRVLISSSAKVWQLFILLSTNLFKLHVSFQFCKGAYAQKNAHLKIVILVYWEAVPRLIAPLDKRVFLTIIQKKTLLLTNMCSVLKATWNIILQGVSICLISDPMTAHSLLHSNIPVYRRTKAWLPKMRLQIAWIKTSSHWT